MARKRDVDERQCDVIGCSDPAVRSIAGRKFSKALPDAKVPDSRRVHICKNHYKKFRKKTKFERKLERMDW